MKYGWGVTDKDIIQRHARLFDLSGDVTQSSMHFGLQVDRGWLPVIAEMCAELELVAPVGFSIVSIKEKNGSLRLIYRGGTGAVEMAVAKAKERATLTCDQCGEAGELRQREGLWAVRCGECAVG